LCPHRSVRLADVLRPVPLSESTTIGGSGAQVRIG
jgi:hypothetical protein